MERIKERLQTQRIWNTIVDYELKALWKYGVERISNKALKKSIIFFLEHETPAGFFVNPASRSGKHHPKWQNEKYGLLRNTTECCILVDRFIQMRRELCDDKDEPLPEARDVILAATILSDTFKYGVEIVEPNSMGNKANSKHGEVAAEIWIKNTYMVPTHIRLETYAATKWHLGRWTPGWTPKIGRRFSPCMKVVHMLDMMFADSGLELLYTPKHIIE